VDQIQTENIPIIETNYKSSEFDTLFLETIDYTFSTLLGNDAKPIIFSFLDKKYKLSKKDIPGRISDFVNGVEQIFGTSATLLELVVMKNLKKSVPSFNYSAKSPDLSFEGYADSLRKHIENL